MEQKAAKEAKRNFVTFVFFCCRLNQSKEMTGR